MSEHDNMPARLRIRQDADGLSVHINPWDDNATAYIRADVVERLVEAAKELAQYASYAEIVGGIGVNRQQIRRECDNTFAALAPFAEVE